MAVRKSRLTVTAETLSTSAVSSRVSPPKKRISTTCTLRGSSSASGWLAVIDQLALLRVTRTVPGHGPVATDLAAALDAERRYLRALIDGVRDELAQGGSMQQAIAQVTLTRGLGK